MYQEENGVWGGAPAGPGARGAPAGCGAEPRGNVFAILDPTFMRILLYDHTISPTVRLLILHGIYIMLNAGGLVHELTL
eukprot:5360455-Prymnesium_polylepis.1